MKFVGPVDVRSLLAPSGGGNTYRPLPNDLNSEMEIGDGDYKEIVPGLYKEMELPAGLSSHKG